MSIYDSLNDMQKQAVFHTEGPLLILAGAGSGKTRVLTHRIAYLIEECGVNPWSIMAITFTNKAAGEMRERVDSLVGFGSESIWVSTFHSSCVKILRRFIDRIGFSNDFTIYDTEDQKSVMKSICKRLDIDTKKLKEKTILNAISSAKNEMISPEQYYMEATADISKKTIAQAYIEYQNELKKNNALDFDDLLVKTVELFKSSAEVLEYYQNRFKYILVDEYQDTNTVQFMFVSYLASRSRNLCVVGDDDQSIYKFRGANINNILNFEKLFEDARVIKLEQNYRSTSNILNAANGVIANNKGRKSKRLWTDSGDGNKVVFRQIDSAYTEAEIISEDMRNNISEGKYQYRDMVCLYRTNAQSRILEEKFISANIPYKIVGGVNFYQRKEIKDILAYLKTIANAKDDVAVKRIINIPKRGIGASTIAKLEDYASANGMNFYDVLKEDNLANIVGRSAAKIKPFVDLIQLLRTKSEHMHISDVYEELMEITGYVEELKAEDTDESKARLENIDELFNKIVDYEENNDETSLNGFLEEVALIADIDSLNESDNYVVLMTIHSAKGLEFPKVYLCGMEDGLFPSYMTITSGDISDIEEERRLCYVAITRAKQELMITSARMRMIHGQTQYNNVSRFIKEIPEEVLDTNFSVKKMGDTEENIAYKRSAVKQVFNAKPFEPQKFKVTKAGNLEYEVGDTVKHIKFGLGIVVSIIEGGRDYEVEVDFEKFGTKKLFASFAKLKKV